MTLKYLKTLALGAAFALAFGVSALAGQNTNGNMNSNMNDNMSGNMSGNMSHRNMNGRGHSKRSKARSVRRGRNMTPRTPRRSVNNKNTNMG